VTFGQAFAAARADERFGHAAIDSLLNGRELERKDREQIAAMGGWDADAELRKAIEGLDPDEIAFVVENGRRGPASLSRALARLEWRRETDRTVARADVWTARVAAGAVHLTNPVVMLCAATGWLVVRRLALNRSSAPRKRPFFDLLAACRVGVKDWGGTRGIDRLDAWRQPSQTDNAVGPFHAADAPKRGRGSEDSGPEQARAGAQVVGRISGGDWAMAALSFLLTPLAPLLLSIYNFVRARRAQGLLYLAVLGVQCTLLAVRFAAL
jgi:hypothetical protein